MLINQSTAARQGKKGNNMKTASKPVTVSMKKPTKKQIEFVLTVGTTVQNEVDKISEIIRADFWNRDKTTNQSALTVAFDKIMNVDNKNSTPEMRTDLKRFIRKQVQTLVKEKATQQALLGDKIECEMVTVKKINNPMVENNSSEKYPSGRFIDNFNEVDLGSYRVVREHKPVKPADDILEALIKFMDAHDLDTNEVRVLCDLRDEGKTSTK